MARCGGCGAALEVGTRQRRRIAAGVSSSLCRTCRGRPVIEPREQDYRFWLNLYGVKVPNGGKALDVVRASGMPEELADLATEFVRDFPDD